jgi:FMN phosphatase YigB (HAD superfamily)
MNNYKTIIFDLDNCLAPVDRGNHALFRPVIAAIEKANEGTLSASALAAAFEDLWHLPMDLIEARHNFSPAMRIAARAAYRDLVVTPPIAAYADVSLLERFQVEKFLVTTGFPRLQESKIHALELGRHFRQIYIDRVEDARRIGKIGYFARILQDCRLAPHEALVVGDNPDSEIDAGNRLGIPTAQILRPGIASGNKATFLVRDLAELLQLVSRANGSPGRPRPNLTLRNMPFPPAPHI